MGIEKFTRGGEVAVLVNQECGWWSVMNPGHKELLMFEPFIVDMVLRGGELSFDAAFAYFRDKHGIKIDCINPEAVEVRWLPEGRWFDVAWGEDHEELYIAGRGGFFA